MARKTSSGLPFLVRRKDVGKYVYWRILDQSIAPFVRGEIHRSWAIVRIPTQSGRGFRFEAGHRSDLIPATIPK